MSEHLGENLFPTRAQGAVDARCEPSEVVPRTRDLFLVATVLARLKGYEPLHERFTFLSNSCFNAEVPQELSGLGHGSQFGT